MASSSPLLDCARIDDSFGPWAGDCRGGFDFTLLFEQTILSVPPLVFLLLLAPLRIRYLSRKKIKVVRSQWLTLKLVRTLCQDRTAGDPPSAAVIADMTACLKLGYAAYGGLQLAILILWARPSAVRTRASIAVTVLALVGSLFAGLLSYMEHLRCVRPSFILDMHLFFSLIFDIAYTRTLWLQQYNRIIAIVVTVMIAVKAVVLLLETIEKRGILQPQYREYPPEATSGIFNRSFFWWINPLLRRGFKSAIAVEDLYVLDKHLGAEYLQGVLKSGWDKGGLTILAP